MKFVVAAGLFLALLGANDAFAQLPTQTVQVRLDFQDNSDNEDGFYVYRCFGVGCIPTERVSTMAPRPGTGPVMNTEWITNDPGGRTVGYAVSAFNSVGESAKSATAYVVTPTILLAPNAPAGINAVVVGVTIP